MRGEAIQEKRIDDGNSNRLQKNMIKKREK